MTRLQIFLSLTSLAVGGVITIGVYQIFDQRDVTNIVMSAFIALPTLIVTWLFIALPSREFRDDA